MIARLPSVDLAACVPMGRRYLAVSDARLRWLERAIARSHVDNLLSFWVYYSQAGLVELSFLARISVIAVRVTWDQPTT